jgi:hypothetical protein
MTEPEPQSPNILLLGATGYMQASLLPHYPATLPSLSHTKLILNGGGSILTTLLAHPIADTISISALVRKPSQASILKDTGVTPLLFKDLDDYETILGAAKDADGLFLSDSLLTWGVLILDLGERRWGFDFG